MLFDNPFFDKLIRLFCLINYIRLFKGFFFFGGGGGRVLLVMAIQKESVGRFLVQTQLNAWSDLGT